MNTRTKWMLMVFACLALAACNKEEKEPSGNDPDASGEQTKVATLLDLSSDSVAVTCEGGSPTITVTSDGAWTAVSDKDWCVPEPASGSGDGKVTLTVAAETLGKADTARVTVTAGSLKATVVVTRAANPAAVTDCQGHTYPVVKIGEQYWMAENLQCTQYDTESERAGAELGTSGDPYDPYYIDGRNATSDYDDNLTPELRAKLGLLYNWTAAMGYASREEASAQAGDYDGDRQGICPNGWHLPSKAELTELKDYVEGNATGDAVLQFMATSGWYDITNATDAYGFAALPAGYANGGDSEAVESVGKWAFFLSSRGTVSDVDALCLASFLPSADFLEFSLSDGMSVRCVRNAE